VGFSDYSKSPIAIVFCPLNALIECYMEELKQRGISCTCLSGDGGDKDGAIAGKLYASPSLLQIPRRLSSPQ